MVLNASYVCLLHSHFINNYLIWILKDEALISKVFLSHTHQTSPGKRFGKTIVRPPPRRYHPKQRRRPRLARNNKRHHLRLARQWGPALA
jgi:hypothetical protein